MAAYRPWRWNLGDANIDEISARYSGVAWATAADFEKQKVNPIMNWPGTGRTECKVPTELYYGKGQEKLWGYEIPTHEPRLQLVKLLLLDPKDLSSEMQESHLVQRARDVLHRSEKTAIDVIADYLELLWKHTEELLKKTLGKTVVSGLPFHFVITIPAIWKPYARQRMEEAVKKTGMMRPRLAGRTYLSFVPEPEAAALATLLDREESIRQGNIYVVCDAGGGTVVRIPSHRNPEHKYKGFELTAHFRSPRTSSRMSLSPPTLSTWPRLLREQVCTFI